MAPYRVAQRKAVKFRPSTMSEIDVDADSDSSDGQTPPPIPARATPTPVNKRIKLDKGIDLSNVIRTPAHSSTSSKLTASDDEDPNPKRQRVTRHQEHNPLNYDTRIHPLDKYTRPAHFAKVNKEYGRVTQESKRSDTSDENANDNNVGKDDDASQTSHNAKSDTCEHEDADTEKEPIRTSRTAKRTLSPRLSSPHRWRSSRTLGRSESPNYDMKIHPDYDRVHRPATIKAASRRRLEQHKSRQASARSGSASALMSDDSSAQSVSVDGRYGLYQEDAPPVLSFSGIQAITISPLSKGKEGKSSTPAKGKARPEPPPRQGKGPSTLPPPEAEGPLQLPPGMRRSPSKSSSTSNKEYPSSPHSETTLDFNDLSSLDSRLYRLQKGAPTLGNTLPNSWDYVKQILFDNGEISLDALYSDEGTDWIKARYEEVRVGVEAFWTTKPDSTDDRDWILRHMKSFSGIDQKRGSKYWRQYEDNLYRPISTSQKRLGQVAETDNDEESSHESDDPSSHWPHRASDRGTSPWIVGTDEVASGASSPSYASAEEGSSHNFEDENRQQGYIDLGDEGEEQSYVDPDRTLVESMRDATRSSDPIISTQELTILLSGITDYAGDHWGTAGDATGSVKDTVLSDPASFEFDGLQPKDDDPVSPTVVSPKTNLRERGALISSPTLLEAFRYVKKTWVSAIDQTGFSQHTSQLQASSVAARGQTRKSRNEQEVIIHEDSPDRQVVAQKFTSPRTDLPKENLEEEEEPAKYPRDILVRTPTTRRHGEPVNTPPVARVTTGGNAKTTPTHLSFFGGPVGQVSPLA